MTNFKPVHSIIVETVNLPNICSPEQVFTHVAHLSWAIWLDSNETEHVDSRFDILVWQPKATFETIGRTTKVAHYRTARDNAFDCYETTEDPLTVLTTEQNRLFKDTEIPTSDLPFLGGALGYFSYDLGRRFETLPTIAKRDINAPDMAVGLYSQALIFDRQLKKFFIVCDACDLSSFKSELNSLGTMADKANSKTKPNSASAFKLNSAWLSNMSKEQYTKKFNNVQSYLLDGDCYQINLAQRFKATYQGNEFDAYLHLREKNKAPFSAFMRLNDNVILSISPERFLKLSDQNVQSKPIKGTKPRSADKLQDANNAKSLAASQKDRAENLMIVDLLRNDISKVCQPGTVNVPKLFAIESFPAVHHLVSTVEGKLSPNYHACDLLRGAFPGGSITGAPKIRAMEIIEELEPHHRSVYCGSIGYISVCGNMDTSITIRTLICNKGNIYAWAGGGLVADSKSDPEYQETFDKVSKILPVLSALS